MRSSTWAWVVTSSAVVGSSAMRSRGDWASASAITARWLIPPESSWGYESRSRVEGRVGAHDVHRETGRQDDVERLVHDEIQTIDGVIEVRTYVVTDIKYESSLNIRGVIN